MQPIRAKLLIPRPTPDLVTRTHLVARLNQGLARKLTLISAPAGFGKTTILAEWLQQVSYPAAWVTLDEGDDDLFTFLTYVVAAIRTVYPTNCQETQSLLNAPSLPPNSILVATLANELAEVSGELLLVLDDFQAIQQIAIHNFLDTLINYLPPNFHLALGTRIDPPLSLMALRARGQVTELRQRDLRFTTSETSTFIHQAGEMTVDGQTVTMLDEQVAGWAAGLRLLLLTMRSEATLPTAAQLRASDTYVMDYLADQVLAHQSPQIQTFLLRSAIVEHFHLPLCRVLGAYSEDAESGAGLLARIVHDNLFVSALGEGWYHYHPLFRELLCHQLELLIGHEGVAELHRQASSWYATQGLVSEAIQHALQAGDETLAISLIAHHRLEAMNNERWQQLERWQLLFPRKLVEQHPILMVTQAWLNHTKFRLAEFQPMMQQLRIRLAAQEPPLDLATQRVIEGELDALTGQVLCHSGHFQAAQEHAQRSLELLPLNHSRGRGIGYMYLSGGHHYQGDAVGAQEVLARGLAEASAHPNTLSTRALIAKFNMAYLAFDVALSESVALELMAIAQQRDMPESLYWGNYFLGLLAYQCNELELARQHFQQVIAHCYITHPLPALSSYLGLALICQAEGGAEEAMRLITEAFAYVEGINSPGQARGVRSCQALLSLIQGKIDDAVTWAELLERQLAFVPIVWFEVPHITLVKTLLTQGSNEKLTEAALLISRLQEECRTYRARLLLAELLVLEACLHERRGERAAALTVLEEAILLAQPGRPLRLFADLGLENSRIIAALLYELTVQKVASDYFRRIQSILGTDAPVAHLILPAISQSVGPMTTESRTTESRTTESRASQISAERQQLIEPLTRRELDVLVLLAQGLLNKEIGQQLFISPKTVERHTQSIYAKLGVKNRTQAVARAREIELLLG